MRTWISFCFLALFFSVIQAQDYLVHLKTDNVAELRAFLESRGHDIAGYNPETQELGVITSTPHLLEKIHNEFRQDDVLSFTISETISDESYRQYRSRSSEDTRQDYYGPDETKAALEKMEKDYPQWAKLYNLNNWLGEKTTSEGRSLYGLQVSLNPASLEDEPKILMIGQHHARELMTHHAVLDAAQEFLAQAKKGDPQHLAWLENSAVWFVPVVNPDGLHHVMTSSRMWRKNRARNSGGTIGVDLNRNYEFLWGSCGNNSSNGGSNVYRGPKANSEPEVRVMDKLNQRLKSEYIVSYHSYGDEVLYPYVCGQVAEAVYYEIRDDLSRHLGYGRRVASSSGEDFEHHYNHHGSISFLLEIGTAFQPSFSTYTQRVWPKVKKVLPYFLAELHKSHLYVQVSDEKGQALPASLKIKEIDFKLNERKIADSHGSYRWRLKPGNYTLEVSLKGYLTQTSQVSIGSKTVIKQIQLSQ